MMAVMMMARAMGTGVRVMGMVARMATALMRLARLALLRRRAHLLVACRGRLASLLLRLRRLLLWSVLSPRSKRTDLTVGLGLSLLSLFLGHDSAHWAGS